MDPFRPARVQIWGFDFSFAFFILTGSQIGLSNSHNQFKLLLLLLLQNRLHQQITGQIDIPCPYVQALFGSIICGQKEKSQVKSQNLSFSCPFISPPQSQYRHTAQMNFQFFYIIHNAETFGQFLVIFQTKHLQTVIIIQRPFCSRQN